MASLTKGQLETDKLSWSRQAQQWWRRTTTKKLQKTWIKKWENKKNLDLQRAHGPHLEVEGGNYPMAYPPPPVAMPLPNLRLDKLMPITQRIRSRGLRLTHELLRERGVLSVVSAEHPRADGLEALLGGGERGGLLLVCRPQRVKHRLQLPHLLLLLLQRRPVLTTARRHTGQTHCRDDRSGHRRTAGTGRVLGQANQKFKNQSSQSIKEANQKSTKQTDASTSKKGTLQRHHS